MTTGQPLNIDRCSFCTREDVPLAELVKGPEASICASCVETSNSVLQENAKNPAAVGWHQGWLSGQSRSNSGCHELRDQP